MSMTYLFLYIIGLLVIWYIYKVGWIEALKLVVSVLIPSILIILFNIKAGRLLFKSPIIGIISALPTSIFIYRGSKPLVFKINNWIDHKKNSFDSGNDAIDTESIPIDD